MAMSKRYRILFSAIFLTINASVDARASVVGGDQAILNQSTKAKSDLVRAASQYKASVQALLPHYEDNLKTATEALAKRKELFERGLVSKRDIESAEQAVKDAQAQLDQTRQQLTESDQSIAEADAESIKPSGSAASGRYASNAAVMRYNGVGGWALTQASKVEGFFTAKFGRQLPISAFGQSATHNRLGFDHRNSVDVALHPDSAEGKS
jgi:multidrug efflux pump subunit AcrA (membrane-fusion protein)